MPEDDNTPDREYARSVWQSLYGQGLECRKTLANARSEFRTFFKAGHQTQIDGVFEDLAEKVRTGETLTFPFMHLNDVHPSAWDIILQHGKHYRPTSWNRAKPWEWELQPLAGSCFLNSIQMVWEARKIEARSRAVYVEGFCMGPLVHPMLHAWNGVGFSGRCVDWSFYASTMFSRYFGIPFTFEEYQYINENGDGFSVRLMFRRDNFEKTEQRLIEVLKKPRTRLMRTT